MFTSIRFCRDINIGKITVEEKHKWFVDVETGGLWGTLNYGVLRLSPVCAYMGHPRTRRSVSE